MTAKLPPQGKDIQPNPIMIYFILIILAAAAVVGLDYLNWEKGKKSYIFSSLLGNKAQQEADSPNLFDITQSFVRQSNLPPETLSYYRDEEGYIHIMLKLTESEYNQLHATLHAALQKYPAEITTETRPQDEKTRYLLWRVESQTKERLYILFLIQSAPEKKEESIPGQSGRVALIIDDLGYSLNSIQNICDLKQKLTVAVLPHTPLAVETARIAQRNKLEVILHLPLESLNNNYDNDHTEGLIHSGMGPEAITAAVDEGMLKVPYIRGVNTHMGSKMTQNPEAMRIILNRVKEKKLYFIDSRTTADSVALAVAKELGIPSARRHIFLDGEINHQYIKNQFIKLLNTALHNGYAVGICHPYPETLETLRDNFHLLKEYGLSAVYASEIVE